jgi:Amt family ammonium transporter
MAGAAAALAGVLVLGPRKGKYSADGRINAIPGANMPLATLGMFILWFGWFGFNGGSQLALGNIENGNAVAQIFVNTNLAACGGVVSALLLAQFWFGKADLTMALNGALGGLVAITASPLDPSAEWSVLIGAMAGLLVVTSIVTLDKLRLDDPVGAISVHGVCGILGLLVVPLNSDVAISSQLIGLGAIFGWVFVTSLVVWLIIKATFGIRISEQEEYDGADASECGIEAYPEFTSAP